MLLEHPDINVVVGGNEYSAVGAARAVRDLGLGSQIQMIGFDSSIEELQMLGGRPVFGCSGTEAF